MASNKHWWESNEPKWDPALELGYREIDDEHRIFHGLVVDFQDAVMQNASKEDLVRILEEIARYAESHFASEEKIMADRRYPELDEHVRLHHELLAEVRETCAQFQQDKIEPTHVYEFLLNWFAFHTSHEDKKLVGYLTK